MLKTINELVVLIGNWDLVICGIIFLFPWALGLSIIIDGVIKIFTNWLWKGMNEEARYMYLKVSKW